MSPHAGPRALSDDSKIAPDSPMQQSSPTIQSTSLNHQVSPPSSPFADADVYRHSQSQPSTPQAPIAGDWFFGIEEPEQIRAVINRYMETLGLTFIRRKGQRCPVEFVGQVKRSRLRARDPDSSPYKSQSPPLPLDRPHRFRAFRVDRNARASSPSLASSVSFLPIHKSFSADNLRGSDHKLNRPRPPALDPLHHMRSNASPDVHTPSLLKRNPNKPKSQPTEIQTLDIVSIYQRDLVPLGGTMTQIREETLLTTWDVAEAMPLSIVRLTNQKQLINKLDQLVVPDEEPSFLFCRPVFMHEAEFTFSLGTKPHEIIYSSPLAHCIYHQYQQLGLDSNVTNITEQLGADECGLAMPSDEDHGPDDECGGSESESEGEELDIEVEVEIEDDEYDEAFGPAQHAALIESSATPKGKRWAALYGGRDSAFFSQASALRAKPNAARRLSSPSDPLSASSCDSLLDIFCPQAALIDCGFEFASSGDDNELEWGDDDEDEAGSEGSDEEEDENEDECKYDEDEEKKDEAVRQADDSEEKREQPALKSPFSRYALKYGLSQSQSQPQPQAPAPSTIYYEDCVFEFGPMEGDEEQNVNEEEWSDEDEDEDEGESEEEDDFEDEDEDEDAPGEAIQEEGGQNQAHSDSEGETCHSDGEGETCHSDGEEEVQNSGNEDDDESGSEEPGNEVEDDDSALHFNSNEDDSRFREAKTSSLSEDDDEKLQVERKDHSLTSSADEAKSETETLASEQKREEPGQQQDEQREQPLMQTEPREQEEQESSLLPLPLPLSLSTIFTQTPTLTINRELCAKCGKAVYAAEEVSILAAKFHSACFRCSHLSCNLPLTLKDFVSHHGKPYCKKHVPGQVLAPIPVKSSSPTSLYPSRQPLPAQRSSLSSSAPPSNCAHQRVISSTQSPSTTYCRFTHVSYRISHPRHHRHQNQVHPKADSLSPSSSFPSFVAPVHKIPSPWVSGHGSLSHSNNQSMPAPIPLAR